MTSWHYKAETFIGLDAAEASELAQEHREEILKVFKPKDSNPTEVMSTLQYGKLQRRADNFTSNEAIDTPKLRTKRRYNHNRTQWQ